MDAESVYRVVLVFDLQPGQADEELRRSRREGSVPDLLSRQPGFVDMELVKVSEDRTMSLQTWRRPEDWLAALSLLRQSAPGSEPSILVERTFYGGEVVDRR